MYISEFFSGEDIIHDCSFEALGLSNSEVGKRFLSFLDNEKYLDEVNDNNDLCALIISRELLNNSLLSSHIQGIVVSDNPRKSFFELHNRLAKSNAYCLSLEKTKFGENCAISPTAIIDDKGVIIGDDVTIEDYVTIKAPCIIGNNTYIHAGAHIGGVGFEFKRYDDYVLDVYHCGSVEVGDNVIIWDNVTIHKAVYPWDKTLIGNWCRIGANTHIDHGAKLHKLVEVCAGCTISGRVKICAQAFVGPGTTISNRIVIGKGAKVLIGSVVTKDVPAEMAVSGNFAIEHRRHIEQVKEADR